MVAFPLLRAKRVLEGRTAEVPTAVPDTLLLVPPAELAKEVIPLFLPVYGPSDSGTADALEEPPSRFPSSGLLGNLNFLKFRESQFLAFQYFCYCC